MRVMFLVLGICMVLLIIGMFLWMGLYSYSLHRDIQAYIDRAQVASNATDMIGYLEQAMAEMEERGLTEGSTALIFKTPQNDLALIYKAMQRNVERLKEIENLPREETTYNVALDDIRGAVREIPVFVNGLLWSRCGWIVTIVNIVAIILAILFFGTFACWDELA